MKKLKKFGLILTACLVAVGVVTNMQSYATVPGTNTLVSINNSGDGQGGNGSSGSATDFAASPMSANGRYVAFVSTANNLVTGDTNGSYDVFVRDLTNNVTTRASVSTAGVQGNNTSGGALSDNGQLAISGTGRYVVFMSQATNLIDGQTISTHQLYIRDMVANTTRMVTQKSDGTIGNGGIVQVGGVSDDGRFVTWIGDDNTNLYSHTSSTYGNHVYRADLRDRSFMLLSAGVPSQGLYITNKVPMSCDGTIIAISTQVRIDSADTDSSLDIYLFDLRNGSVVTNITGVSNSTKFSSMPTISCNGNYVSFLSNDTVFSPLVGSGSTKSYTYVYNRIDGTISIADVSTGGILGNSSSRSSSVDNEGNTVFTSPATNLIDGTTTSNNQTYLKHYDTGVLELLSKTSGGAASNGVGGGVSISANGRLSTYHVPSTATTLLSSDTNGQQDLIASSTGL